MGTLWNASALGLWVALAVGIGGCEKSESSAPEDKGASAAEPSSMVATAVSAAEARKFFNLRCATCHGKEGRGDGVGGKALNPKPRDYRDKEWQASVTDDQLRKTIVYGGAAVGKSANMPNNPDLDGKPEMVDAIVKIIREFGKQ
jgi:mono/diheme cytochrome c family protein